MASIWQKFTGTAPSKKSQFDAMSPNKDITFPNNILNLQLGDSIRIDTIELSKEEFEVVGFKGIARKANGNIFPVSDYIIKSDKFPKLVLRVFPGETNTFILLNLLSSFGYDKGFHDGLNDESNKGEMEEEDDNGQPIIYNRMNNLKHEWNCFVTTVNKTGISTSNIDYWDYARTAKNDVGVEFSEFYFLEMNKNDGFFEAWMGPEIEEVRISKL